jgi:hypothetical protein
VVIRCRGIAGAHRGVSLFAQGLDEGLPARTGTDRGVDDQIGVVLGGDPGDLAAGAAGCGVLVVEDHQLHHVGSGLVRRLDRGIPPGLIHSLPGSLPRVVADEIRHEHNLGSHEATGASRVSPSLVTRAAIHRGLRVRPACRRAGGVAPRRSSGWDLGCRVAAEPSARAYRKGRSSTATRQAMHRPAS